jgi:drug/metabolite transporter (DMT)-like permease
MAPIWLFYGYGGTLRSLHRVMRNERDVYIKGVGLALLAVVLWSGNFIVARGLNKAVPPVSLAFFRWLFATVLLFPLAFRPVVRQRTLFLPHWRHLCFTAVTGVSIFNTLIYVAGKYTTATNLALIGTTASPLFVLLLSALFLKTKPRGSQLAGALICLSGILLLLTRGQLGNLLSFRFSTGDLWVLAAALSFAIYTLQVRKKPPELSATAYLFAVFLLGTLFLLPAWVVERNLVPSFEWTLPVFFIFLYLGLGASVISFLAWNGAIHKIGPTRTALFGNLIPVLSSIEAVLILGESFTWVTILSMGVILVGIVVANRKRSV